MKKIKKFNNYNENKVNDSESIATDLLDKISNDISVKEIGGDGETVYVFTFEDKKIRSAAEYSTSDDYLEFSLQIDDVKVDCSEDISERINSKLRGIYKKNRAR